MKGGHSRSGPPPDPNALRRERDRADWVTLPASGRQGEPPLWPLPRPRKRELAIWEEEWRRPQAIMWEANGQEREVALYVRTLVAAEKPKASAQIRTLIVRWQEVLGLSQPGLLRLRWRIAGEPAPQAGRATGTEGPSAKARFRVVQGGS